MVNIHILGQTQGWSSLKIETWKILACPNVRRAAQIFFGFLSQAQSLSLTQTVTPYQFLGPYGIVLPHPKSFEVGHFNANIEIKWPTSKLSAQFVKPSCGSLGLEVKMASVGRLRASGDVVEG